MVAVVLTRPLPALCQNDGRRAGRGCRRVDPSVASALLERWASRPRQQLREAVKRFYFNVVARPASFHRTAILRKDHFFYFLRNIHRRRVDSLKQHRFLTTVSAVTMGGSLDNISGTQ
ncbi:MAG TPA: hypothetical protein ENK23_03860 [Sorangium sp.]|nr:hypothetical protein [Sorangium sp.]